jgi:hypothetical protein
MTKLIKYRAICSFITDQNTVYYVRLSPGVKTTHSTRNHTAYNDQYSKTNVIHCQVVAPGLERSQLT